MKRRTFLQLLVGVPAAISTALVAPKFASGGLLPPARPYLVGEQPLCDYILSYRIKVGDQWYRKEQLFRAGMGEWDGGVSGFLVDPTPFSIEFVKELPK
jgi:hypothetical protein